VSCSHARVVKADYTVRQFPAVHTSILNYSYITIELCSTHKTKPDIYCNHKVAAAVLTRKGIIRKPNKATKLF